MSASEQAAEDRTEAATPKRLDDARARGQLPVSRDVTTLSALVGAALGTVFLAPGLVRRLAAQCADTMGLLDRVQIGEAHGD